MITMQDNEAVPLYFDQLQDEQQGRMQVRLVDTESTHYQLAKDFMIRLQPNDLDDLKLANIFGLSSHDFRKRYAYLVE